MIWLKLFGGRWAATVLAGIILLLLLPRAVAAETLALQPLIREALANNRDLRAAESRIAAAGFRITQAWGLPDPMVSIGYQNEGLTALHLRRITGLAVDVLRLADPALFRESAT